MCISESNNRIISLLAQGKTVKEISGELNIPARTVEKRLLSMRRREGCRTTVQLVLKLIAFNLSDYIAKV